jgi:tetratricopeptide (TPR) repeat protein
MTRPPDPSARNQRRLAKRSEPDRAQLIAIAADALRRGAFADVERASRMVLAQSPDHPDALNFLGLVALRRGRGPEAVAILEQAVKRAPRAAMIRCNLAFALRSVGRLEDAAHEAAEAARIEPSLVPAHAVLGTIFVDLKRPAEALAPLERALELSPGLARALFALGDAHQALGRDDDARRSYEQALQANPIYDEGRAHLGWLHVDARRYEQAAHWFRSDLVAKRASPWWPGGGVPAVPPAPATPGNALKLRHDAEQMRFLLDRGLVPAGFADTLGAYESIIDKIAAAHGPEANVLMSPAELGPLADGFARIVHWRETPAHAAPALGDSWDRRRIETQYADPPGLCWVDGLLSQRALDDLRQFCLESTIWNDVDHNYREDGTRRAYLGTYAHDGFCCPLLFQIAEELTRALPAIFKDHRLRQMWAYKYEPSSEGIDLHGDNAAINVNFWITPDDANRNPDSGGLVVYPIEAPGDWNFDDYNKSGQKIRAFLEGTGTAPVNIPYRQNRAVIFNSDLFHATAPLDFKPGYENRRINVTMLFGARPRVLIRQPR